MPHAAFGLAGTVALSRYLSALPLTPEIGIGICPPYIRVLDVSKNANLGPHIGRVADALIGNTALESLNASACDVGDEQAERFASVLEENSTLTHLDLSHNPRICTAGDSFAMVFNVNHTLVDFSLEGTGVSDKTIRLIDAHRQAVGEPPELQVLLPLLFEGRDASDEVRLCGKTDLKSGRLLKQSSAVLLGDALRANYVVTHLDVSHNKIDFEGATAIISALQENRVTLKSLDLSYNPIGHGAQFGRHVAMLITSHSVLRDIRIAGIGMDTAGARAIANELDVPRRNGVCLLDVTDNNIAEPVVHELATLVAANAHPLCLKAALRPVIRSWSSDLAHGIPTTHVAMDAFTFGEDETPLATSLVDPMVGILVSFFRGLDAIESLSLRSNRIGDAGAAALAAWLEKATTCQTVDLTDNRITETGVAALAEAVRRNYKLRIIEVAENPSVSRMAAMELRGMLAYNDQPEDIKDLLVGVGNGTIVEVDESPRTINQLNDTHVRLLATEALQQYEHHKENPTGVPALCSVNLSNNYITVEGFLVLLDLIDRMPTIERLVLKNTLVTGTHELGRVVAAIIARSRSLRILDLSYNEFDPSFASPILEALEVNNSLRVIGLAEAGLTKQAERAMSTRVSLNATAALKSMATKLRNNDPDFKNCSLVQCGYSPDQVAEVVTCVSTNTHVEDLDVSGNELEDPSFLQSMATNVSVTRLDLSGNLFGPSLLKVLRQVFQSHRVLRYVDIRENPAITTEDLQEHLEPAVFETDSVVELLAGPADVTPEMLADPDHPLHFLSYYELNVQPSVKRALGPLERRDPELVVVDASGDPGVTDVGVELLVRAAQGNMHIRSLVLSHGKLTDRAVCLLDTLLIRDRAVTHLDVSYNHITDVGAGTLASLLSVSNALRFVDIRHNQLTGEGLHRIAVACRENRSVLRCAVSDSDHVPANLDTLEPFDIAALSSPTRARRLAALLNTVRNARDAHAARVRRRQSLATAAGRRLSAAADAAAGGVGDRPSLQPSQSLTDAPLRRKNTTPWQSGLLPDDDRIDRKSGALLPATNSAGGRVFHQPTTEGSSAEVADVDGNLLTEAERELVFGCGLRDDAQLARNVFLNCCAPAVKRFLTHGVASMTTLDLSNLGNKVLGDFDSDLPTKVAQAPAFSTSACAVLCDALLANRKLTKLSVANNNLSTFAAAPIAQMIAENTTLRLLDLSGNHLRTSAPLVVASMVKNHSILHLDLSRNDAAHNALERLELLLLLNQEPLPLKEIVVTLTEERGEPRDAIVECPVLPSEEEVYGASSRGHPGATPVPGHWTSEDETTTFWRTSLAEHALREGWSSVRKPQMDDASVVTLCEALSGNGSIRRLSVARNALTDVGLKHLVELLAEGQCRAVGTLDLGHNLLTATSVVVVAELVTAVPTITSVSLAHNMVEDDACLPHVFAAFHANPQLVRLDLTGNRLSPSSLTAIDRVEQVNLLLMGEPRTRLIDVFRGSTDVEEVDLSGLVARGMWRPDILTQFVTAIPTHNLHVRTLRIEFNDLGNDDLQLVAKVVADWPALNTLSLAMNLISNVDALCQSIRQPKCGIRHLDLRGNDLGQDAARTFAHLLRESDQLHTLDVSQVRWGSVGAAILLGALPMNDSLTHIAVEGPGVTQDQILRCETALTLHYKHVSLRNNAADGASDTQRPSSASAAGAAVHALRANRSPKNRLPRYT